MQILPAFRMHNEQNLTRCEPSPDSHDYMTRILGTTVWVGHDRVGEETDGILGRCLKRMTRATRERMQFSRQRTSPGTMGIREGGGTRMWLYLELVQGSAPG